MISDRETSARSFPAQIAGSRHPAASRAYDRCSLLADLGTVWFGLPEGYWAVITCLVVVQGTLGGTLEAGISRIAGTIAGALLGGVGAWVQTRLGVPSVITLVSLVLPLSLLGASKATFRMAPVTAALVVLAIPSSGGSLDVALYRMADIALGGGIGALTALFVFPEHAANDIYVHAATALVTLGKLARLYLTGGDGTDELINQAQSRILKTQTACAEAMRERSLHLASGPSPELLLQTIRRLRTDVMMIGQAVGVNTGVRCSYASLSQVIAPWFVAAADALKYCRTAPDLSPVDKAAEGIAPTNTVSFVYALLRRDLADLSEQINHRCSAPSRADQPNYSITEQFNRALVSAGRDLPDTRPMQKHPEPPEPNARR